MRAWTVMPNCEMAATLNWLGIGKDDYRRAVFDAYGIDLYDPTPAAEERPDLWSWSGEQARAWQQLQVRCQSRDMAWLRAEQLVELLDNASYGGVLSIAGYAQTDQVEVALTGRGALRIEGRVQIGIIDYLWGSGHSIRLDQNHPIDLHDGKILTADRMCHRWDSCCDFVRSMFRFESLERIAEGHPVTA
jgi:hypothetical protein